MTLEEQAKEPFCEKASPKTLTQIEVCTLTRSAVNCGKGMEYCKVCGVQDTNLLTLEFAQKLQAELDHASREFEKNNVFNYQTIERLSEKSAMMNQENTALSKRNCDLERKLAEAKQLIENTPYMYACEKEVYYWQEVRENIERLRGILK